MHYKNSKSVWDINWKILLHEIVRLYLIRIQLRFIHEHQPKLLIELAELIGWQVPSLSSSLRKIEGYGLVKIKHNKYDIASVALTASFRALID